jgi:hypothetical protein
MLHGGLCVYIILKDLHFEELKNISCQSPHCLLHYTKEYGLSRVSITSLMQLDIVVNDWF